MYSATWQARGQASYMGSSGPLAYYMVECVPNDQRGGLGTLVLCQQGQKHERVEEGSSNHRHAGDLAALKGSRSRMDIM